MNKAVLIAVPAVLVVGGGVVGAAMMGIVQIPGLSPEKKKAAAAALYSEEEDIPPISAAREEPPVAEEVPQADLVKGRKELAKLWNEMESAALAKIVEKWPDEDLAHQLRYLDIDKTAEILSMMKPERASAISKTLQALGSTEPAIKQ